jgi:cobalamin biosynthesis protein CbiG
LLRTLVTFYRSGANTGTAPLLEQYRLAWLYAPDAVVNRLCSLLETQRIDPAESHMTEEQKKAVAARRDEQGSRALAEAVAAMRADLFATSEKSTRLTAEDFRHYY